MSDEKKFTHDSYLINCFVQVRSNDRFKPLEVVKDDEKTSGCVMIARLNGYAIIPLEILSDILHGKRDSSELKKDIKYLLHSIEKNKVRIH